jgi:putative transposase
MRKAMAESTHPRLSVRRQCELLAVNRNRIPEEKLGEAPCFSEEKQRMIRRIDELYLKYPELGARRMSRWLQREGHAASRRLLARLMKHMGLEAIYRKPRTSTPNPKAKKYPYLLKGIEVMGRMRCGVQTSPIFLCSSDLHI